MKRVFLSILFILIVIFNINSMVIHGQLDDGFILEENSSQHLFFIGLDTIAFNHIHSNTGFFIEDGKYEYFKMDAILMPFYHGLYVDKRNDYGFLFAANPIILLPLLSLGYIARWHINSKMEINFNTFVSSPRSESFIFLFPITGEKITIINYKPNIYGPGISIGIGFKRKINKSEKSSLSYKVNFGIDYTGDMFIGASLKNSILIGIQREHSILSLNPFINLGLRSDVGSVYFPPTPLSIVFEPGFELTSKFVYNRNFSFISSFMIGYEGDLLIFNKTSYGDGFLYSGKIVVSASFGLGSIVIKN
ncbi:MAG TPA: hypothetical protein PLE45_09810 [Spirochaetota bacterium]|nr:hypothetical protein [Spirochaetota bacterium]HPP04913.1 hypothetical protein [Spirochaetota bacterium]